MNPLTSSRPRIESAASWSPAIQPSVRVSNAAMSSSERFRPITPLRNSAASEGAKRKSAARSSASWPRARNRARGRFGSSRVAMTRCIRGGRGSSTKARGSAAGAAAGAQPGQGQIWILTGGDDEVHPRRQVIEQKGEGFVDRFGIDCVVVVQDQDEIVLQGCDLVEQVCQDRFGRRCLRG